MIYHTVCVDGNRLPSEFEGNRKGNLIFLREYL